MATPETPGGTGAGPVGTRARAGADRLTDETKPAFKTTEFMAYVAILAGVFIAGLLIKGGENQTDELMSNDVWTLAVVLTFGYMLSRGIAKSGSRHRYTDDDGGRY